MTMTTAQKNVQEYRDAIHTGNRILSEDYSYCVYLYDVNGKACAAGYTGRRKKPSFVHSFGSVSHRETFITNWMTRQKTTASARQREKECHLQVGDVLKSCWGYEQTNVDFFLVTKRIGKSSVEIREIGQRKTFENQMQGSCFPDTSKIIGEPLLKRVRGDRVRICSFSSASKLEYQTIDGKRVYPSSHWSAYH